MTGLITGEIDSVSSIQCSKIISDIDIFQRFLECVGCPSVFGPAIQHDVALAVLIEELIASQMVNDGFKIAGRSKPACSGF